jgi:hypothetical protein
VYSFVVAGNSVDVSLGQTVEGVGYEASGIEASGARGEIVFWNPSNSTILVKVKNQSNFVSGEQLFFSIQSQAGEDFASDTVRISGAAPQLIRPDFNFDQLVTAINPSATTTNYDNLIGGTITSWDVPNQVLILENDKEPINSDYNSDNKSGSFIRAQQVADQASDILRVGDLVSWSGLIAGYEKLYEIKSMRFTDGVDFVSENSAKETSAVAKYTTKEIALKTQASGIDVIITANVSNSENIKLSYKTKTTSVQKKFEDIEWVLFNDTGMPINPENATPQNTISAQKEEQSAYQEFRYSVDNLDDFISFGVKVTMSSDDPAYVPKIQDIRVVASV